MAGPATSASEPRALQLVEVKVPLSSLGTMVARVWGRTPRMTRKPSSACTYKQQVRQGTGHTKLLHRPIIAILKQILFIYM